VDVPPPGVGVDTVSKEFPTVAKLDVATTADISVADPKLVFNGWPFKLITEETTKPAPVTTTVTFGDAATTVEGETAAIVGAGLRTSKFNEVDVPPPGLGLETVIESLAFAVAKLAAGMMAVSWVVDPKVVLSVCPAKFTNEAEMKLLPVTVIVKSEEPTRADEGETLVTLGTGFVDGVDGVELLVEEEPPPQPRKSAANGTKNRLAVRGR